MIESVTATLPASLRCQGQPRPSRVGLIQCLDLTGLDPETGKTKTFSFDHSYWSHDGFSEKQDGCKNPHWLTSLQLVQALSLLLAI